MAKVIKIKDGVQQVPVFIDSKDLRQKVKDKSDKDAKKGN